MKNYFFLIVAALLSLLACQKSKDNSPNRCLETTFEEFKAEDGAVSILKQTVDGEDFYWLHSNVIELYAGGVELIINVDCETVCTICGDCAQTFCLDGFNANGWEPIWEK